MDRVVDPDRLLEDPEARVARDVQREQPRRADLAFAPPREEDLGIWAALFHFADKLNLTYNLLPSLHVAFAVICVAIFSARAPLAGKVLLWFWAAMVAASTVLLHQHHLLDVATGWLLALVCVRLIFDRFLASAALGNICR